MKLWPTFNSTVANVQQLAISSSNISCWNHHTHWGVWGPLYLHSLTAGLFSSVVITYLGAAPRHAETSALCQWQKEVQQGKGLEQLSSASTTPENHPETFKKMPVYEFHFWNFWHNWSGRSLGFWNFIISMSNSSLRAGFRINDSRDWASRRAGWMVVAKGSSEWEMG